MITPRQVKQRMQYALLIGREPIYETDAEGNIVYRIIAGEQVPKKTGDFRDVYSNPIEFINSISGTLSEDELQAFGTLNTASAKMTYKRGQYPFKTGTLIWKTSEVEYTKDGNVDPDSADYRVLGVMTEGQYFWRCILQAVPKNETSKS